MTKRMAFARCEVCRAQYGVDPDLVDVRVGDAVARCVCFGDPAANHDVRVAGYIDVHDSPQEEPPVSGGGPSDGQLDALLAEHEHRSIYSLNLQAERDITRARIRSLFTQPALPDPKEVARKIYDALATNADRWMASLDIGEQEPGTLGISQRDAIVRVLTEAYGPQSTQEEPR